MTFTNYKQLSKSKYFKYRRLEAWRLGVYVNDDGDDDEVRFRRKKNFEKINIKVMDQVLHCSRGVLNSNFGWF